MSPIVTMPKNKRDCHKKYHSQGASFNESCGHVFDAKNTSRRRRHAKERFKVATKLTPRQHQHQPSPSPTTRTKQNTHPRQTRRRRQNTKMTLLGSLKTNQRAAHRFRGSTAEYRPPGASPPPPSPPSQVRVGVSVSFAALPDTPFDARLLALSARGPVRSLTL